MPNFKSLEPEMKIKINKILTASELFSKVKLLIQHRIPFNSHSHISLDLNKTLYLIISNKMNEIVRIYSSYS